MSILSISPEMGHAQLFLELLSPAEEEFTFQTFSDLKDQKRVGLTRQLRGSLRSLWPSLRSLNEGGAGVFAVVNKDDGRGRRTENIVSPRALFVDSDTGPVITPKPPPTILVQSKRGQHAYWCLREGENLSAFSPAQKLLAYHLKTDPAVHDVPRLMRVPGFIHWKNPVEPTLVKVLEGKSVRYSIRDVLAHYPPLPPSSNVHTAKLFRTAAKGAEYGSRNLGLCSLVGHLLSRRVDPVVALELVMAWNRDRNLPPLPEVEIETTFYSIAKSELRKLERTGRKYGQN